MIAPNLGIAEPNTETSARRQKSGSRRIRVEEHGDLGRTSESGSRRIRVGELTQTSNLRLVNRSGGINRTIFEEPGNKPEAGTDMTGRESLTHYKINIRGEQSQQLTPFSAYLH